MTSQEYIYCHKVNLLIVQFQMNFQINFKFHKLAYNSIVKQFVLHVSNYLVLAANSLFAHCPAQLTLPGWLLHDPFLFHDLFLYPFLFLAPLPYHDHVGGHVLYHVLAVIHFRR